MNRLRTIIVELKTCSNEPIDCIEKDLLQEIGCCWNSFEIVSITEKEVEHDEL